MVDVPVNQRQIVNFEGNCYGGQYFIVSMRCTNTPRQGDGIGYGFYYFQLLDPVTDQLKTDPPIEVSFLMIKNHDVRTSVFENLLNIRNSYFLKSFGCFKHQDWYCIVVEQISSTLEEYFDSFFPNDKGNLKSSCWMMRINGKYLDPELRGLLRNLIDGLSELHKEKRFYTLPPKDITLNHIMVVNGVAKYAYPAFTINGLNSVGMELKDRQDLDGTKLMELLKSTFATKHSEIRHFLCQPFSSKLTYHPVLLNVNQRYSYPVISRISAMDRSDIQENFQRTRSDKILKRTSWDLAIPQEGEFRRIFEYNTSYDTRCAYSRFQYIRNASHHFNPRIPDYSREKILTELDKMFEDYMLDIFECFPQVDLVRSS